MKSDIRCPHCGNDREDMIEELTKYKPISINDQITQTITYRCDVCSKPFDAEIINGMVRGSSSPNSRI